MRRQGIIIGGGASGLAAAIHAARNGAAVTILEHMPRVGKKILSTGNGKCNLTNLHITAECYRSGEADFPMQVISRFPVSETLKFFRSLGVLTTDKNGYVYPVSGQAQTVLDALRSEVERLGVRVVCDCEVQSIDHRFTVNTNQGTFTGDFLILAAGSMAAPVTGSDGSGYELAKQFGHKIKKPLPALVQLRCEEDCFRALAGIRTEAKISLYRSGRNSDEFLAEDTGELQLTDYGLSGIPVFQVSRYASEALNRKDTVSAVVDFFLNLGSEELFAALCDQREYLHDRECGMFLDGFFHKRLAQFFLKCAGIDQKKPVSGLTDQKLAKLTAQIKEQTFHVTATNSYDKAQVCMGGVKTTEIDSGTMESRLVPGLYFAGEILDVDGICGGYNLQWAWSSAYLAGVSAVGGMSTYD